MLEKTKIYFASDFHLGIPDYESSLLREKKFLIDELHKTKLDLAAKEGISIDSDLGK